MNGNVFCFILFLDVDRLVFFCACLCVRLIFQKLRIRRDSLSVHRLSVVLRRSNGQSQFGCCCCLAALSVTGVL